jgi:hypothetical protein
MRGMAVHGKARYGLVRFFNTRNDMEIKAPLKEGVPLVFLHKGIPYD